MKFFGGLALAYVLLVTISSCSSTPKVTSQFNTPGIAGAQPASISEHIGNTERESVDGLGFYISHDDRNLYLTVDFISNRLYQQAMEFGFTIFVDNKNSFKKSFGITYPTGLYYELGEYPGARKGYLAESDWETNPNNLSIKQTSERAMYQRALISQRSSRQQDLTPFPVPLPQLEAQNIRIITGGNDNNNVIFFTIPLETRSTSQFSPDIASGESLRLGFEIDPIRLLNLASGLSIPRTRSQSRTQTGVGETSSNDDEELRRHLNLIMRRLIEPYEQWIEVTLKKPADNPT